LAAAANNRVEALEQQLQAMQYELQALRSQAARTGADPDTAKVQELEQWMNTVKATPVSPKHDNDIFFRGGFARNDDLRNGVSIQSNVVPVGAQERSDQDGWYIGAGFDFGLTDDVWGMMGNTEVLAELMFEYKRFGSAKGNCLAQNPTCLAGAFGGGLPLNAPARDVTINQFSLTASPKIKFMKGSNFRPWLIPIGLGVHVISPPSESITVLNPGMMFAGGADYRLWKDIFVGADVRYHYTSHDSDGVNTNGLTAGGYIGIGF
jgi:opacity protein-like surface antigen